MSTEPSGAKSGFRLFGPCRTRLASPRTPSAGRRPWLPAGRPNAPQPSSLRLAGDPGSQPRTGTLWIRLVVPCGSAPRMQSHGSPANLAISVMREMLPFERGAMMNFRFSRVRPATVSGHGRRRCHALFRAAVSASLSPRKPNSGSSRSSASSDGGRQGPSTGAGLLRTRSMLGMLSAPASANAEPSIVTPLPFPTASTWAATDVRQSTTVPKTSKTSAFTDAGWMRALLLRRAPRTGTGTLTRPARKCSPRP